MLSILIPTYNYNVVQLVKSLHQQCTACSISFEILVLDDCSTNQDIATQNNVIRQLNFVQYNRNRNNIGNANTRIQLAKNAQYNWLLFLDADTLPVHDNFIQQYLHFTTTKQADVFGGNILYQPNDEKEYRLKLLHGKKHEEIGKQLNEDSYIGLRGANFLIKKRWFQPKYFIGLPQKYGYVDTVFGINLKQQGAVVKLVDNPVYHLGLEPANRFLFKTQQAIENAVYLEQHYPAIAKHLKIVRFYEKLQQFGVTSPVSEAYKLFRPIIQKNLFSKNPSLLLFQFYKIGLYINMK